MNDNSAREAVEKRAAFKAKQLTPEERTQMRTLARLLAERSTETLGEEMIGDSETATDENADDEDRKTATYRYGSRTVRIYDLDQEGVTQVANAGSITAFLATVFSWFL